MSGVIVFGLAAFMPFVVFKLLPVAAAAVVAQGVASAPMRAGQQGMQMQYYGRQLTSGGKVPGKQAGAGAGAGGGGAAGGAAAAAGGGAGAAAAGPAGVAVAGVSMAAKAVKNTADADRWRRRRRRRG